MFVDFSQILVYLFFGVFFVVVVFVCAITARQELYEACLQVWLRSNSNIIVMLKLGEKFRVMHKNLLF